VAVAGTEGVRDSSYVLGDRDFSGRRKKSARERRITMRVACQNTHPSLHRQDLSLLWQRIEFEREAQDPEGMLSGLQEAYRLLSTTTSDEVEYDALWRADHFRGGFIGALTNILLDVPQGNTYRITITKEATK
jgi:hypothetical protein